MSRPPQSVLSRSAMDALYPSSSVHLARREVARTQEGDVTTGGDALRREATFTHDIPDAPVIVSPGEDEVVDLDAAVSAGEPVTGPVGRVVRLSNRLDVKIEAGSGKAPAHGGS